MEKLNNNLRNIKLKCYAGYGSKPISLSAMISEDPEDVLVGFYYEFADDEKISLIVKKEDSVVTYGGKYQSTCNEKSDCLDDMRIKADLLKGIYYYGRWHVANNKNLNFIKHLIFKETGRTLKVSSDYDSYYVNVTYITITDSIPVEVQYTKKVKEVLYVCKDNIREGIACQIGCKTFKYKKIKY